ncbi:hypothetical protein DFH11DRAFT_893550 [Phellopilus nigrolimitatus]|nr:hypothetical protein DFH11DRAFT_893550 [Phellopilus nigrolimitatus]
MLDLPKPVFHSHLFFVLVVVLVDAWLCGTRLSKATVRASPDQIIANMNPATGLPALDNTMGALYLAVVLSMALWGVGCVQLYYYFNMYPEDKRWIKTLVITVWVFDSVHQGLIIHSGYTYLITNYGNPLFLTHLVKSLVVMVLMSGIICLLVQSLLVYRVWKLSHQNIFVVSFLMLLVLGEFISAILYFAKAAVLASFDELRAIFNESRSINILGAASDIMIAFTLIFLLQRSRTGFSRSETIINRLILFTINTGLLTSLCALMSLIFISLYPNAFIYITFFVCVSKLYSNTLYATLNARASVAGVGQDTGSGIATSSYQMGRLGPNSVNVNQTSVNVNTTVNRHTLDLKSPDTDRKRSLGISSDMIPDDYETNTESQPSFDRKHNVLRV